MKLYKRLSVLLSMGIMVIGLTTFTMGDPGAYAQTRLGADALYDALISGDDRGRDKPADGQTGDAGSITSAGDSLQNRADSDTSDDRATVPGAEVQSGENAAEPVPTPVPNRLTMISGDSDVYRLIRSYLDAKLKGTREAFEGIVTDPGLIDLTSMARSMEAVVGFEDLECYTKHGIGDIDYVVFYTYEMDIVTIRTPLTSIDMLYVMYDEDGDPRIFIGELDDETSGMIREMIGDEDVRNLIEEANSKMEKALMSDEGLRAFWERLSTAA